MRILMIGDIVGKPGRTIVTKSLARLRTEKSLDCIIANAENAAGGSGLTPDNFQELRRAGVDCVTLGDHAFKQKSIFPVLESDSRIVIPGNYPPGAPGRHWTVFDVETQEGPVPIAVFCLLGRIFMQPVDSPLFAADAILKDIPESVKIRILDYHAEATAEKQLMGRYLDGRVSAVLGTHTHVATADETILPGGTAFQCDVGMTGPFESIIGRRIDRVMETTRTFRPVPFDVARNDLRINSTLVDIDPLSGKARSIERLVVYESETGRPDREKRSENTVSREPFLSETGGKQPSASEF
ncbi:MAG: YmdB family metallophosphoesterase [Thermoguttaceae bacterium]|nr:YmdB family metallophosphoesterase [Thermoguttaceae bacterium]